MTLGISAATLVAGLASATAGEKAKEEKIKKQTAFPTLDILPEGSILRRVRLPRYDKDFNPTSLFTAEKLTVIDQAHIEADDVTIDRYGKDGSVEMSTKMRHAVYNQTLSTLNANQAIYIKGKTYLASGTGLIFDMKSQRGFLNGPATTVFQLPPSDSPSDSPEAPTKKPTAMQLKRPYSSSSIASMAGTLITLSTCLIAEPPARLTAAELAEMDKLATPMSQQIKLSQAEISRTLEVDSKLASDADASMIPFLKEIKKGGLLVQALPATPAVPTSPVEATPKPQVAPPADPKVKGTKGGGDPKKSVETTLKVECDGGLYFDSDTGVLAYLKNVRLTEPRFSLTCSHQLKVFLEQKPKKPSSRPTKKLDKSGTEKSTTPKSAMAKVLETNQPTDIKAQTSSPKPEKSAKKHAKADKAKDKSLSSFNGLKRIIASGNVKVTQKDEAGKLFIATAETASYDGKTGEMILRGGRPRLQQSANQYLQADAPRQYIRIQKNGKLVTSPGKWSMQMTTKK